MARSKRSSGVSGSAARTTKRRRERASTPPSSSDNSDSDDEDTAAGTSQSKRSCTRRSPEQMMLSTRAMTDSAGGEGDGVSSIQGSMTDGGGGPMDLETWRRMEERLRTMEEKVKNSMVDGGVSVVSESTVSRPTDENIIKENLRKFVAAKVFPSWKFLFKKEQLSLCVVSAVKKGYVTVPAGFRESDLASLYSPTVRTCIDGCRANAQTCARKRYLGK